MLKNLKDKLGKIVSTKLPVSLNRDINHDKLSRLSGKSEKTEVIATTDKNKYEGVTVLLDAGHAKSTPGKRSPFSLKRVLPALDLCEYDFNRKLQERIVTKLNDLGIHTEIITPEVDKDISLTTRAMRANKIIGANPNNKHIFISIHANAAGNGSKWMSARGFEAWTTKGLTKSDNLAECICEAAEEILKPNGITIRMDKSDGDKDKEENFTVLYKVQCPAVLTENLFYDNIEDCKIMLSDDGKDMLADVHVQGILKYIEIFIFS